MQAKDHCLILGIIFIFEFTIYSLFALLFGAMFIIQTIAAVRHGQDGAALAVTLGISAILVLIPFVFLFISGMAAWKLLKNRSGARTWGIVASVVSLPFFVPIGVLIGVYGFWFLTSDDGKNYLQGGYASDYYPPAPQKN